MSQTYIKPEQIMEEKPYLGSKTGVIIGVGLVLGLVGLGGAIGLGMSLGDNLRGFWFAFLLACFFFLSIGLGSLFFIMVIYAARGGWNVVLRRIAEFFSANLPLLGLLILAAVAIAGKSLYIWFDHQDTVSQLFTEHQKVGLEILARKTWWLTPPLFMFRIFLYSAIWAVLSQYFMRKSIKQDKTGDPDLTNKMWITSAPGLLLFAITTTLAAFDLLMSLYPFWFSTIFGVYIFAGCVSSSLSVICLTSLFLQSQGHLKRAITTEHYHDLGKLMFAFTFFWGYIAFSQYMLTWYANFPEETIWYLFRQENGWTNWSWLLLLGKFVIPFAFLLNRHIKRNRATLALAALWIPIMHWVDLYYVVMPVYSPERFAGGSVMFMTILATIGIGGLFFAGAAMWSSGNSIIPLRDPRLGESLRFDNIKV